MTAVSRLQWQPHPEGGFVAYPEPQRMGDRFAQLLPNTSLAGAYVWRVRYDAAHIASIAGSRQLAADQANEAWPKAIKKAAELADRTGWKVRTADIIDRILVGELAPEVLEPERLGYADLMWIMDRIRHYTRLGPVLQLQDLLSREFFSRRTRGLPKDRGR